MKFSLIVASQSGKDGRLDLFLDTQDLGPVNLYFNIDSPLFLRPV